MPLLNSLLPHQPVIRYRGSGHPTVSCNCRVKHGVGPMGMVVELTDTVRLYNDSGNHVEPFSRENWISGPRVLRLV